MSEFNTKRDGISVMIVETGEVFNSIKACADYIGGNAACVSRVVNGGSGYITCHGYHITRVGEKPVFRENKKIMIVETGEVFNSIRECAEAIDGSPGAICEILNHKNRRISHKGYHFKRV